MNESPTSQKTASFLGVLGAFLVVGVLVWAMRHYTRPPAPNQARADERRKALAEIRAAEAEALNNYGWADQSKGLVRLKEDRAMELTVDEYKNPAVARTNLVARAEKAVAPPPKAPEAPGKYE